MIDPRGRITGRIALNETGSLDVALPPVLPVTRYARWGDWPVVVLLLIASLIGIATRKRLTIDEGTDAPLVHEGIFPTTALIGELNANT